MSDTRVMKQECQSHIVLSELLKVFYYASKTHFHQERKKVVQK